MSNKLIKMPISAVRALLNLYLDHTTKNKWPQTIRVKRAVNVYEWSTGRKMDISNPVTFPEKVIWYKLFYKHPDLSRIVDKYRFKGYIEEKLGPGHTIPMHGAWKSVEGFRNDWDKLPEEFCLKSNLMSDGKGIRIIHRKSEEDLEDICRFVEHCLDPRNTLINSFCQAYYSCKPMVIAEQYLSNIDDQLFDYKIYCFKGVPYTICASQEHFQDDHYPITYYDMNWVKMDVKSGNHRNDDIEKPKHLSEMIEYAKFLSSDFPFVRVDFFDTEEGLFLAELTFYPGGGLFTYKPEEFNKIMGDLFTLPG